MGVEVSEGLLRPGYQFQAMVYLVFQYFGHRKFRTTLAEGIKIAKPCTYDNVN